jgi:hypothetical protein
MVDIAVLVREFLLLQTNLVTGLGADLSGRIYAAADLPKGFDPAKDGPGIQLVRSGGIPPIEIPALIEARLQVRVCTDKERYQLASDVYGAVRDPLHTVSNAVLPEGVLLSAFEITGPQEMSDLDTGWVIVNAFYTVLARPN